MNHQRRLWGIRVIIVVKGNVKKSNFLDNALNTFNEIGIIFCALGTSRNSTINKEISDPETTTKHYHYLLCRKRLEMKNIRIKWERNLT